MQSVWKLPEQPVPKAETSSVVFTPMSENFTELLVGL
jgi:hypothetical protein